MYECGALHREKKDKDKGKEEPLSLFQLWVGRGVVWGWSQLTTAKKRGHLLVYFLYDGVKNWQPFKMKSAKTTCSLRFFDSIG